MAAVLLASLGFDGPFETLDPSRLRLDALCDGPNAYRPEIFPVCYLGSQSHRPDLLHAHDDGDAGQASLGFVSDVSCHETCAGRGGPRPELSVSFCGYCLCLYLRHG